MMIDILRTTHYTKSEKRILELASKEICEQLSEERKQKVDSIIIRADIDSEYIHYSFTSAFLLNQIEAFSVDIMSGLYFETIDGDAAEAIYKRYVHLVCKYALQFKKPFTCKSLL